MVCSRLQLVGYFGERVVQGNIRRGSTLVAKRDSDNEKDKNCIGIHLADSSRKLVAYVPATIAKILSPMLDRGKATVEKVVTIGSVQARQIPVSMRMKVVGEDYAEMLHCRLEQTDRCKVTKSQLTVTQS